MYFGTPLNGFKLRPVNNLNLMLKRDFLLTNMKLEADNVQGQLFPIIRSLYINENSTRITNIVKIY